VSTGQPAAVIVLAAGEGKRMRSRTPKVLHPIGGRSLVGHSLAAAASLQPEHLVVVVRHEREQVAGHVARIAPSAVIADQDEVPGTGSAVAAGLRALSAAGHGVDGVVVVTYADVPLLSGETLSALVAAHRAEQAAVTVLTAQVGDPTGYGRVLRGPDGNVTGIVEQRDATAQQQEIREINSGIYAFDAKLLADALGRITTDNDQNEMYLTDVLGIAHADGHRVRAVATSDLWQVEGVNDRVQLATLGAELNRRVLVAHMRAGVSVVDPATTWVDVDVRLAADVTLLPGTQLHAGTVVATGASIGPDSTLSGCVVGAGAQVVRCHGTGAQVEAGAKVGPFSYLRPGTVLGPDGKIGAFVETKNVTIGAGAKVPHLTYAGDATIGEGANIGAATIFVNYDGVNKHRTTVGAHARVGSDTVLVAPVNVGDGAYTAAGSAITEDVPAGALAVGRGRQHNSEGWVQRRREGSPSARAAEAARAKDAQDPS